MDNTEFNLNPQYEREGRVQGVGGSLSSSLQLLKLLLENETQRSFRCTRFAIEKPSYFRSKNGNLEVNAFNSAALPARDHLPVGRGAMRRSDRPQHLHCALPADGLGVPGEL